MRYDRWDYTFITLAVLAAASSVVCSQFTKDGTGIQWWWLAGQITAVMVAALAPAVGAWRAKRSEVDARTQSRFELNSGLDPVVRKLGELSLATGKRAQEPIRAEIMALIIAAAHQVVGTTNATRSCFFEFVDGPPEAAPPHVEPSGAARLQSLGLHRRHPRWRRRDTDRRGRHALAVPRRPDGTSARLGVSRSGLPVLHLRTCRRGQYRFRDAHRRLCGGQRFRSRRRRPDQGVCRIAGGVAGRRHITAVQGRRVGAVP